LIKFSINGLKLKLENINVTSVEWFDSQFWSVSYFRNTIWIYPFQHSVIHVYSLTVCQEKYKNQCTPRRQRKSVRKTPPPTWQFRAESNSIV